MKYALIIGNVVVQTQPYEQADFIEVPDDVVCGQIWDGNGFVNPPPPPKSWDEIRAQRNDLLAASDWTMLPDAPLTTEQKAGWVAYRVALRNLTGAANPDAVIWPIVPA